ncbi:hypothetical protein [Haloarcula montana]|uniref:hypothetical protein n=1 Tax=Haloarcula montana TaxID=3111776 RepID=UPI002D78F970|nr:hypothetical protein [Haloarcula sp. GH36]
MRLRDRIGISERWQTRISRGMIFAMVGLFAIGIERGSTGIIVNTGIGLLVAQLPSVLERDYNITLDPALTLWISAAVFLHAVGVVGLPGAEQNFYATVPGWDHITHTLSSSVVAAVGYTTVRALEEHSPDLVLPPRFTFVFILLFVMAFGVLWEVIEFSLGLLATATGNDNILTQFGLEDTMLDLVFDTIGAIVVATWGTAHLTDVVGHVEGWLDRKARQEDS